LNLRSLQLEPILQISQRSRFLQRFQQPVHRLPRLPVPQVDAELPHPEEVLQVAEAVPQVLPRFLADKPLVRADAAELLPERLLPLGLRVDVAALLAAHPR
jgi:hypothetical protein